MDANKPGSASDEVKKGYQAWFQSARAADAAAEIEVLKAEAASLLDKHLTKTAEQVLHALPPTLLDMECPMAFVFRV